MLKFRNLTIEPDAPVDQWGFEGLLAAVERGDIRDWHRIAEAVTASPRGKVAAELKEVLATTESPAMSALFSRILLHSVRNSEDAERQEVTQDLAAYLTRSGMTRAEFAQQLGTSPSRLSTYLTGKVVPSAVMMVRARRLAERR
ncbi:helix-turn-helix transcriptional regulator [uncultured Arthrobacter sp.]|uniref:helix-turn-helix domain-containing protein n=1 Tax=uncultured Arthrobacter sp. TaxID=114050 RepID=UPI002639F844|nr:helix-turn-helix transcriptional regulator [uncultured Arthrobacter sp.]